MAKPAKKKKAKTAKMPKFNKYLYYENSVQTPEQHVEIYDKMFKDIRKREALSLREDFCGTFLISGEWVKSNPQRTATGMDLDPEPVSYGMKNGYRKLTVAQKKRVKVYLQDVCVPTNEKFDIIGAANFSFNIFHTREQLKKYFVAARNSLHKDGIFNLELAGGPGLLKDGKEQKTYHVKEVGGKYTYYWDLKSYDPLECHAVFAIHFKSTDGVFHKDCFVYDWRIWSIPELKELMLEAGFSDVCVYWEGSDRHGNGTDVYERTEKGDNAYSWIAFVVGIK